LVNVATGAAEDIPHDPHSYAPTWDPVNPWRLVYDGDWGLVNLDLNLDTTWALTENTADHTPTFSPDGRKIAVTHDHHDHWEIHVLNTDGSGRTRLTETPLRELVSQHINGQEPRSANNVAPAWSPDGSQIAFLSDRTGQWQIWVMNVDGSDQHPMFPFDALSGIEFEYYGVDERMISWGKAISKQQPK